MGTIPRRKAKSIAILLLAALISVFPVLSSAEAAETAPGREMARQAVKEKKLWITADHSKFELLKQEFNSGPDVTKACLSCHSEAAVQFQQTIHWTWMDPLTEKSARLGKGGLSINNF